jgi:hypothetical protein
MLGATVVPVATGSATLKDAINEAMRDWCPPPPHSLLLPRFLPSFLHLSSNSGKYTTSSAHLVQGDQYVYEFAC